MLAPATRPVSDADGDIRAAELAQVRFGLACQLLHDLDAPHPTGKLGQHRGLIAQPRSDLEDALMRLGAEVQRGALAEVAPPDLHVAVLRQLAPADFPLGDALEPGSL